MKAPEKYVIKYPTTLDGVGEVELTVKFTFFPGYPQTYWQPEEPEEIDITEVKYGDQDLFDQFYGDEVLFEYIWNHSTEAESCAA